jgi:hypothetical protein
MQRSAIGFISQRWVISAGSAGVPDGNVCSSTANAKKTSPRLEYEMPRKKWRSSAFVAANFFRTPLSSSDDNVRATQLRTPRQCGPLGPPIPSGKRRARAGSTALTLDDSITTPSSMRRVTVASGSSREVRLRAISNV